MKERIINIGPRLKQRRKEMRIKQTEMAKELGVSQTYLSNIEGGRTNCSIDRKSTRLNSSHYQQSRMPSSA